MASRKRYSCEEVFRRLDDYLDRELTPVEMELVEEHLENCLVCAREYDFEATLVAELKGRLRRISVPDPLLASVQATLDEVRARTDLETGRVPPPASRRA